MKTYQNIIEGITKTVPLSKIKKEVEAARKDIVGKELTKKKIANAFSRALKKWYDLEITTEVAQQVDQGDMTINAYYDHNEDEEGFTPFEFMLVFNKDDKSLTISDAGFDNIKVQISQAIQHELLHQQQWRTRGFAPQRKFTRFTSTAEDIMKSQKYLGNDDEIEAHAKNISSDIRKAFKTTSERLNFLKSEKKDILSVSPNMFAYLASFGFDMKSTVLKKLYKKIVKFLGTRD